jgi:hypothetical protein
MSERTAQLEAARAEVAKLEREIAQAGCAEVGHRWAHIGGCNCGCENVAGGCSVPVYECAKCGDCDYGDNAEARNIIAGCAADSEEHS